MNRRQPIDEETTPLESIGVSEPKQKVKPSVMRDTKPQPLDEKTLPNETAEESFKSDEIVLPPSKSHGSSLFNVFTLFALSWLLYSTYTAVVEAWQTNIWFGAPLAAVSIILIGFVLFIVKKESAAINRVDRNQSDKLKIQSYRESNSITGIHSVLKPRLKRIKKIYPKEYALFEEARSDRNSADDYIALLENVLLSKIDDDANKSIKKASLSIAALVAISPHPALDAVIVFFQANLLIRKISQLYGLEPTRLSSLYLLKHSIISAITAASIEEISSMLIDEVGAGLTEQATKLIAEGLVSSARVYRLGQLTKRITRPI